jgi:hypothetical protein
MTPADYIRMCGSRWSIAPQTGLIDRHYSASAMPLGGAAVGSRTRAGTGNGPWAHAAYPDAESDSGFIAIKQQGDEARRL